VDNLVGSHIFFWLAAVSPAIWVARASERSALCSSRCEKHR
jgi:hypothetical protein